MKIFTSIFLVLAFLISCSQSDKTETPPTGQKITTSDALYELYVPSFWKPVSMPDAKIEYMFISPDNRARFFVMRIPNPPHIEINQAQVDAFIEGIKGRHQNVEILNQKLDQRPGTTTAVIVYLFDEITPDGPLAIKNYCEIAIRKATYLNFCAMAPNVVWEEIRAETLGIFHTIKFL